MGKSKEDVYFPNLDLDEEEDKQLEQEYLSTLPQEYCPYEDFNSDDEIV